LQTPVLNRALAIFPAVKSGRVKGMQFVLEEAARQYGVAKERITKAIRFGKLSITRREDGSWSIENAELGRYLDGNSHSETGSAEEVEIPRKTDPASDILIAELRATIADLRSDRDYWRTVAERLSVFARKPDTTAKRPWWKRFAIS
jgi:hypothetical protein